MHARTETEPVIKAVLFDADGVIQRTDETFRAALGSLISDQDAVPDFLSDIFTAEKPCLTGQREFPAELRLVLEKWQSKVSLEKALAVWTHITPVDFVMARIAVLRENTLCCLASNQQHHRAGIMRNRLGYSDQFDELYISCEIGHAKPGSAFFEHIIGQLSARGISPENIGFIDDHAQNVSEAAACGLQAIQYDCAEGAGRFDEILEAWNLSVNVD